jgi:hypothetical protein
MSSSQLFPVEGRREGTCLRFCYQPRAEVRLSCRLSPRHLPLKRKQQYCQQGKRSIGLVHEFLQSGSRFRLQSLLTVPSSLFVTQMWAPSNATPPGLVPTGKVPSTTPSLARSLLTVSSSSLATQM